MDSINTLGRWLFWLHLGGATIACDGAHAEASAIYIVTTLLVAVAAGCAGLWTGYKEGYRAGVENG